MLESWAFNFYFVLESLMIKKANQSFKFQSPTTNEEKSILQWLIIDFTIVGQVFVV
jgi:hypothetical protein